MVGDGIQQTETLACVCFLMGVGDADGSGRRSLAVNERNIGRPRGCEPRKGNDSTKGILTSRFPPWAMDLHPPGALGDRAEHAEPLPRGRGAGIPVPTPLSHYLRADPREGVLAS